MPAAGSARPCLEPRNRWGEAAAAPCAGVPTLRPSASRCATPGGSSEPSLRPVRRSVRGSHRRSGRRVTSQLGPGAPGARDGGVLNAPSHLTHVRFYTDGHVARLSAPAAAGSRRSNRPPCEGNGSGGPVGGSPSCSHVDRTRDACRRALT